MNHKEIKKAGKITRVHRYARNQNGKLKRVFRGRHKKS